MKPLLAGGSPRLWIWRSLQCSEIPDPSETFWPPLLWGGDVQKLPTEAARAGLGEEQRAHLYFWAGCCGFLLAHLTKQTDLCLQSRAGQPACTPLRARLLDSKGGELLGLLPLLNRAAPQSPILAPSSPRLKLEWMPQKVRMRSQTEVQSGHAPPPQLEASSKAESDSKIATERWGVLPFSIWAQDAIKPPLLCRTATSQSMLRLAPATGYSGEGPWTFKGRPIWRPHKVFHTAFLWFYRNKKKQ